MYTGVIETNSAGARQAQNKRNEVRSSAVKFAPYCDWSADEGSPNSFVLNLSCDWLNINVRKMLRILCSLLCIKYFFFWSYRSAGFKGNIEYTKKVYVRHIMH